MDEDLLRIAECLSEVLSGDVDPDALTDVVNLTLNEVRNGLIDNVHSEHDLDIFEGKIALLEMNDPAFEDDAEKSTVHDVTSGGV